MAKFGLEIKTSDWSEPVEKFGSVNFLDVSFWFDENKSLQTDLFKKPTDSRSYLNFRSCHPNYTFAGTVKSQAIRLRRIINNDTRLSQRLDELASDFRRCGYPVRMLNNILGKVKSCERSLVKKVPPIQSTADDRVMVISTFGKDHDLVNVTKKIEKHSETIKFKYVKKTGPSLRNILIKSKISALGKPFGETLPCNVRNCKACRMVSCNDFVTDPSDKKYKTAPGRCNTKNLIYHAKCKHCHKAYTGKTTQSLNSRISGHRAKFVECLYNDGDQPNDDDHLLGLHLYQKHYLRHRSDFDDSYEFTILENCNPNNLDLKEHVWVQRLRCVAPYGLNSHDPFGIPIIL